MAGKELRTDLYYDTIRRAIGGRQALHGPGATRTAAVVRVVSGNLVFAICEDKLEGSYNCAPQASLRVALDKCINLDQRKEKSVGVDLISRYRV